MKEYDVTEYGVSCAAQDNSGALQRLMDMVSEKGGGTLWVPVGTYRFQRSVWARSYVSIAGENKNTTVLKMVGEVTEETGPFALFYHHYPNDREAILADRVVGCTYHDFTVDASELVCDSYRKGNKAFYYQNCFDCTWRDLRLIATPATALGVDCLVNCFITRIFCQDCGRVWEPGIRYGGAAIGIGAGLYDEENVTVTDCIVENSGHFGIFFEHQTLFNKEVYRAKPRGIIITDCVVRGGRNHGIGVRGMTNVKIVSNLIYENHGSGVYVDNQAENIDIGGNTILDNREAGVRLHAAVHDVYSGTTGCLDAVSVHGNTLRGNGTDICLTGEEGRRIRGLCVADNLCPGAQALRLERSDCHAAVEGLRVV